jgi:hypothetical protein
VAAPGKQQDDQPRSPPRTIPAGSEGSGTAAQGPPHRPVTDHRRWYLIAGICCLITSLAYGIEVADQRDRAQRAARFESSEARVIATGVQEDRQYRGGAIWYVWVRFEITYRGGVYGAHRLLRAASREEGAATAGRIRERGHVTVYFDPRNVRASATLERRTVRSVSSLLIGDAAVGGLGLVLIGVWVIKRRRRST